MKNKDVYKKILQHAEQRLKYTLEVEESYKQSMLEETFRREYRVQTPGY